MLVFLALVSTSLAANAVGFILDGDSCFFQVDLAALSTSATQKNDILSSCGGSVPAFSALEALDDGNYIALNLDNMVGHWLRYTDNGL